MDVLLLIFLSTRLAGKFKSENKHGAGKYILSMVGTVVLAETIGVIITRATASYIGLLLCMAVGVTLVVLIYKAGAKKAVSVEQSSVEEITTAAPEKIRASALICAVGAVLTGTFGAALGYAMSVPMTPEVREFNISVARLFKTGNPPTVFFALMCMGTLVLSVGYFMMASLRGLRKNVKTASVFCAITMLAYSFLLIYSIVFFNNIYKRMLSSVVPIYIPIILTIIALTAFCLHLASVYRQLNKIGRVLAAICIIVFGIVCLFEMYTFIAFIAHLPKQGLLYATWFRAPVVGFLLLAFTMISLALSRKIDVTPSEVIPILSQAMPDTATPNQSAPIAPITVSAQATQRRTYEPFTGNGVCDVCNAPLGGGKAFIVPNNVFYNSPKYRAYYKQFQRNLTGMNVPDAVFTQMLATDATPGSAVCEKCIHMFE